MFKDRDMKLNTARGSRKQRRRVAHRGGLTALAPTGALLLKGY